VLVVSRWRLVPAVRCWQDACPDRVRPGGMDDRSHSKCARYYAASLSMCQEGQPDTRAARGV